MKRPGVTIKLLVFVYLLLVGCLGAGGPARAEVQTTEKASGQAGMVFVAGNPDLYPLEYYDETEKCYKGAMPALLEELSRQLGVDFVYVSAGSGDQREHLAKNGQVEVMSGCMVEESLPEHVTPGRVLFPITVGEKTYGIGFAYTRLTSENLQSQMESHLSAMDAGELMNLVTTASRDGQKQKTGLGIFWILVMECLLFVAFALFLKRKRAKQEEEEEANKWKDPVTGAGNKEYFLHHFSASISDSARALYYILFVCFDISRVNAYYGEAEAESMLRHGADVLGSHIRNTDFYARVTGGGFAVACQQRNREQAEEWAGQVLDKINQYNVKFNKDYRPEFHAGIYKLRQNDLSCETALYAAQQGYREARKRRTSCVFSDETAMRTFKEQQELCKDFIQAVESHQFRCYLQFIQDVKTGNLFGAEVVSRWNHPEKGLLRPGRYIEDMERHETIAELDFYMFEETCRFLQTLQEEGKRHLVLCCIFSEKTLALSGFFHRIQTIAQRYRFDHDRLCIMLTERSMQDSHRDLISNIQQCKESGFLLGLDDVGAGYSSFVEFASYSLDLVKIDKDLLLNASQEAGRCLLQGMNALFHSLEIRTVCGGVETQEQCRMVQETGTDYIQGFYVQRALPVKEAMRWLKEVGG